MQRKTGKRPSMPDTTEQRKKEKAGSEVESVGDEEFRDSIAQMMNAATKRLEDIIAQSEAERARHQVELEEHIAEQAKITAAKIAKRQAELSRAQEEFDKAKEESAKKIADAMNVIEGNNNAEKELEVALAGVEGIEKMDPFVDEEAETQARMNLADAIADVMRVIEDAEDVDDEEIRQDSHELLDFDVVEQLAGEIEGFGLEIIDVSDKSNEQESEQSNKALGTDEEESIEDNARELIKENVKVTIEDEIDLDDLVDSSDNAFSDDGFSEDDIDDLEAIIFEDIEEANSVDEDDFDAIDPDNEFRKGFTLTGYDWGAIGRELGIDDGNNDRLNESDEDTDNSEYQNEEEVSKSTASDVAQESAETEQKENNAKKVARKSTITIDRDETGRMIVKKPMPISKADNGKITDDTPSTSDTDETDYNIATNEDEREIIEDSEILDVEFETDDYDYDEDNQNDNDDIDVVDEEYVEEDYLIDEFDVEDDQQYALEEEEEEDTPRPFEYGNVYMFAQGEDGKPHGILFGALVFDFALASFYVTKSDGSRLTVTPESVMKLIDDDRIAFFSRTYESELLDLLASFGVKKDSDSGEIILTRKARERMRKAAEQRKKDKEAAAQTIDANKDELADASKETTKEAGREIEEESRNVNDNNEVAIISEDDYDEDTEAKIEVEADDTISDGDEYDEDIQIEDDDISDLYDSDDNEAQDNDFVLIEFSAPNANVIEDTLSEDTKISDEYDLSYKNNVITVDDEGESIIELDVLEEVNDNNVDNESIAVIEENINEEDTNNKVKDADTNDDDDGIDEKAELRRGRLGTLLIVIGVLFFVFAIGTFIYSSTVGQATPTLHWAQSDQYTVPDGLLQDGQNIDAGTDLIYIYDVASGEEPYAVEEHATLEKDGLFGKTQVDWYETYKDSGNSFSKTVSQEGPVKVGEVTNYKRIIVHLPKEARESVSRTNKEEAEKQNQEAIENETNQIENGADDVLETPPLDESADVVPVDEQRF